MDRREFLQTSILGTLATSVLGDVTLARAQAALAQNAAPVTTTPRRLIMDAYSRHLHWLRTADEVAEVAIEMTCGGVNPTIQQYPGHIDPVKVTTELRAFVKLNAKHNTTLMYHTRAGANSVGSVVWDLLYVMKDFDPKYVGFHWDTGHMTHHGSNMWELLMRTAGPYVVAMAWKDRSWEQDLGLLGEGGPYTGPHPRVEPLVTQPDGSAVPGAPRVPGAAGRGAGAPAGGRGAAGRSGRGRSGGGDEEDAPLDAARGGRSGPLRGPANPAGAGSIDANNPLFRSRDGEMPKRPIGGKNARGAGWSAPNVAMGTGVVSISRVATLLAEIGFNGPSELQSEYAGIGGAETGVDTLTRPRQWVIGMLKRDVITIRKSFEMADCGLTI